MQHEQLTSPQSTKAFKLIPQRRSGTVPVNKLPVTFKYVRATKLDKVLGILPVKLAFCRFINVRAVKRPISLGIVTPRAVAPAATLSTVGQTVMSDLMKSHAICSDAMFVLLATGGTDKAGAWAGALVRLRALGAVVTFTISIGALVGGFVGVAVIGVDSVIER